MPESLEFVEVRCQICRLLVERARHVIGHIEEEPELLRDPDTLKIVGEVHTDLDKHVAATKHNPLMELIEGLLHTYERRQQSSSPQG